MVDGENCISIPPKSAPAIVEAINRLTGNIKELSALGRSGQKTVLTELGSLSPHSELFVEHLKNHFS